MRAHQSTGLSIPEKVSRSLHQSLSTSRGRSTRVPRVSGRFSRTGKSQKEDDEAREWE
ncbi:MAG: hypothetical protein ACK56I_34430 [bacterium]